MFDTMDVNVEGLAHMIKERTGSSSPITYTPYDQAYEPGFEDMMRRVPCIDKLELLTGFRPATELEEIIDRVAKHFTQKRDDVGTLRKTAEAD